MLEGSMNFEATLVELDRIMRTLTQENEALRVLLGDYEALLGDIPPRFIMEWNAQHIELKARYDALVKGVAL